VSTVAATAPASPRASASKSAGGAHRKAEPEDPRREEVTEERRRSSSGRPATRSTGGTGEGDARDQAEVAGSQSASLRRHLSATADERASTVAVTQTRGHEQRNERA
jgi:hypothetical protein